MKRTLKETTEITVEDKFEWTQTVSTITAACFVGPVKDPNSVKISLTSEKLNVSIDEQSEPVLNGVLFGQVCDSWRDLRARRHAMPP